MRRPTFYMHFAACYGTLWLVAIVLALLVQKHIDLGTFGLLGFPAIALVYAIVRKSYAGKPTEYEKLIEENRKLQEQLFALQSKYEPFRPDY